MCETTEVLEGCVEHIIFSSKETGFTVLELSSNDNLITVVGELYEVAEGEELSLTGSYVNHPVHGPQFKASLCERKLPATANAIYKYLSSGAIKGVGLVTARRMVDMFGDKTLEVIEKEPMKLTLVQGISKNKAVAIGEDFKRIFGIRTVMLFLAQYQVTPEQSVQVYKKWGTLAIDIISENPYLLCGSDIGVSFEVADSIREKMEISPLSHCRLAAGLSYVLRYNLGNGHTCLPKEKLLTAAVNMLGLPEDQLERTLYEEVENENLVVEVIKEREFIFLPDLHRAQSYIAMRLSTILSLFPDNGYRYDKEIDRLEKKSSLHYAKLQREAINTSLSQGIMVLTGGPGTGKTTTVDAILELLDGQGLHVMLAAPTGRAAKRMSDVTGRSAKTIHRLLEVEYGESGQLHFVRNEQNPLNADVIIVDEVSMVDVMLFEALLRGMKLNCRLILVGDSDQLPSVGAGNLLRDIIESHCVTTIELKEIFRQAQESMIVTGAHAVVRGELPDLTCKDKDFFFVYNALEQRSLRSIRDLCSTRLPARFGFDPMQDIQVLSPSRMGALGTANLNAVLQSALNPPDGEKKEYTYQGITFREGDKVMQVKNNYDILWKREDEQGAGIYNGDIGYILRIDRFAQSMQILFDDRTCVYSFDSLNELELAYAVTVHKSQGNEFEAVILVIGDRSPRLLYRNLLYTGITRAKKLLILVSRPTTVEKMVQNNRRTNRYTCLSAFLRREIKGEVE